MAPRKTAVKRQDKTKRVGKGSHLRQRKVSAGVVSKWKQPSERLQSNLLSLLEDALERFQGSEDEEIDLAIDRIKRSFLKMVKKLQIPNEKWPKTEDLKIMQLRFESESERLKELEANLQKTLEAEKDNVEELKSRLQELKESRPDSSKTFVHPILQAALDDL